MMRADKRKLEIAMARACMTAAQLTEEAGIPRPTINRVLGGHGSRAGTIGKIARALHVDVTEILAEQ